MTCDLCARPERGVYNLTRRCCLIRWLAQEPKVCVKRYLRAAAEKRGVEYAEALKAEVIAARFSTAHSATQET